MAQKKKKSHWLSNTIMLLLLAIGLICIFHRPIQDFIIRELMERNSVSMLTADQIAANAKKDASFDFSDVDELDMKSVLEAGINNKSLSQLGGIAIPSLKMNLPIYKGTSEYALSAGAGTMRPDQVMGEGNYPLASHRTYSEDLLFAPLKRIKLNATIYTTDLKYVYTYKVTKKEFISPYDIDVINNHDGKTEITLITCNLDGSKRLMVQGEFVKKTKIEDASKKMIKAFKLKKKALVK